MKYCIGSGIEIYLMVFLCDGSKGNLVLGRVYRKTEVYNFVFFLLYLMRFFLIYLIKMSKFCLRFYSSVFTRQKQSHIVW